jgi:hypothetical protein
LQLADEEALLVYVIDIISTDSVFFQFLVNDREIGLIATYGISFVACEIDGVEISSIKPVLVSCDET